MERKVCPYLGLPDDESTALNFPSEGNFCHRAQPAEPANYDHQSKYCLTGQHVACPVFLAHAARPLPAAVVLPQSRWARARKHINRAVIPAVVLVAYLTSTLFNWSGVAGRMISRLNPANPAAQEMQIILPGVVTDPTQTTSQPEPNIPVTAPQQEATTCPLPQGWEAYVVQPTDSLFRISIIYGVSLEAIQQANCLGGQTFVAPGSVLFVPALDPTASPTANPTATLPATATSAPIIVVNAPASEESSDEPEEAPPPTSVPPTDVPPTAEAPVAQPPAEQPPAEQPPAEQPPAEQPPAEQPPAEQPPAQPPANPDPPRNDPPANPPGQERDKDKDKNKDKDKDKGRDKGGDKNKDKGGGKKGK